MLVTWIATFRHDDALGPGDAARLRDTIAAVPGLTRGLAFTPAATHDPYLDDGRPPALVLQLYFAELAALEASLGADGRLQALPGALPSLAGADVTQQAMLARDFPIAGNAAPPGAQDSGTRCAYLVSYDGTAADRNAFVAHYTASHTAVMARFPGIREIEVCTRLDWCGFLPWPRTDAMLRNKVVFDSPAALTAALNSPVRHEMRADFAQFPAFAGQVTHFPMLETDLS